jgi:hypothetical protein
LLGSDRNGKEAMDQEQKEKLKEERGLGSDRIGKRRAKEEEEQKKERGL